MASAAPRMTGNVGNEVPTHLFSAGIVDSFPRPNRARIVESSITDRVTEFILPTNLTSGGSINDRYLEFRIKGVEGIFLDLSSLAIEFHGKPVLPNGADLPDDKNVIFVNFLSNTIFKSAQVFIGEKLIESNPHFNYYSYIKNLASTRSSTIKTLGRVGYNFLDYKGTSIEDVLADDYFEKINKLEKEWVTKGKKGIHLVHPLLLDVASLDQYVPDSIEVRIKLELSPNAWFMNSVPGETPFGFQMREARLHVDRVIPRPAALMALHKSLASPNTTIQSIFNKTVYRTYTLGPNQTQALLDAPFNNCVPEKLYMAIVNMQSFNGDLNRNPIYFEHSNISNIHITLNGSTLYDINADFADNNFSYLYYETIKSLTLPYDHLMHYDAFAKGRMVMAFNFRSENTPDTLEVEKTGNLRISLSFNGPVNTNRVIILFGETQGVMTVDGQRNIYCDVRA